MQVLFLMVLLTGERPQITSIQSVSTTLLEVGKIAQVLRNLFYKHEDPSSMSRTHVKSLSMVVCFYNPRAGELGHLGPWGSLAIGELQASERLFRNVFESKYLPDAFSFGIPFARLCLCILVLALSLYSSQPYAYIGLQSFSLMFVNSAMVSFQ